MPHSFFVYILSNPWRTIYVGMTADLLLRLQEHKAGSCLFTKKYGIHRLVWFEAASDRKAAAVREKQIKGWKRAKKITLIETMNPHWNDLAQKGFGPLLHID